MKTVRVVIIMMCFLSFARVTFAAETEHSEVSDQSRKRLDDLFRWRVSDTLQLDTKQDAQFGSILDRVHDKRRKAGEEMGRIVGDISKLSEAAGGKPDKKKIESLIAAYEKQMKIYSETQTEELNDLRKVFGTEKLGRYLVFKNELGRKLKSALSSAKPVDPPSGAASSPGIFSGNTSTPAAGAPPATLGKDSGKEKLPEPSIIDHE